MIKGIVKIISNGSKFGGQNPDKIDDLLSRLGKHPLEKFSATERIKDNRKFWGNFQDISAVFNIIVKVGSEADKRLLTMMRINRRMLCKSL